MKYAASYDPLDANENDKIFYNLIKNAVVKRLELS